MYNTIGGVTLTNNSLETNYLGPVYMEVDGTPEDEETRLSPWSKANPPLHVTLKTPG